DLSASPPHAPWSARRAWRSPAGLTRASTVTLPGRDRSRRTLHRGGGGRVPAQIRCSPPRTRATGDPRLLAIMSYSILPAARGPAGLGGAYVRYRSPRRLVERWARAELAQSVMVHPNLEAAKRHSVYLVRSRQVDLEKRSARVRGAGRAFESLREYRQGDEFRDICWTATARRARLVTRVYEIERNQTIWIVLDTGRLMRTRVGRLSKLDCAVNAALALSQVALNAGDRVGLLAYGRHIGRRLPAARGSAHLRQIIEQLAIVRGEEWESDHVLAAARILADQKRRCLTVWITDVAETAMTPEVIRAAAQLIPRHLVLVMIIGQPDLEAMVVRRPATPQEMYEIAAAQEVLHRRELLLARLREAGALALETSADGLSLALVNSYLEIKQRNQL